MLPISQLIPTGETASNFMRKMFFTVGLEAAEKAVFARAPFLNVPVVRDIVKALLRWIGKAVFDAISPSIIVQFTTWNTEAEQMAYEAATGMLKNALAKHNVQSEEVKRAAEEFKKRLGELVDMRPDRMFDR